MPNTTAEFFTYTRRLSHEIDEAYAAYKAGEPQALKRLYTVLAEQGRNVAKYKMREFYCGTVAYDAVHRALMALEDFDGKSRFSTWFYTIARREADREMSRLLKKRTTDEPANLPDGDAAKPETQEVEDPRRLGDPSASLDLAALGRVLPPEQAEIFDLRRQGYTLDEIVERTGLPRGTVAGRIRLLKQKFERITGKAVAWE